MLSKITGVTAAAAVGVSASIAGAQSPAVQWRVEDGGNGHWYQGVLVAPPVTAETGTAMATSMGAHLVDIATPQEWSIVSAVSDQGALWASNSVGPLIGLTTDAGDCSAGCWTTGAPVSFTNWHPGNPDHPGVDRCVFLYIRSSRQWQNHPCGAPNWGVLCNSAIIEWSADCNADGIVDYGQILQGQLADVNANNVPDSCECLGDINEDGWVDGVDLGIVLASWSTESAGAPADLNRDGAVDGVDLGVLLGAWGACSP